MYLSFILFLSLSHSLFLHSLSHYLSYYFLFLSPILYIPIRAYYNIYTRMCPYKW